MDFKNWLESKGDFEDVLSQKGCFKVDNPFINKAAETPEGLAQIIILVISTIRTPFERIAIVYSRLMSVLNTLYSHEEVQMYLGKDDKPIYNAQEDLDSLVQHETTALNIEKKFQIKGTLFGWKWKGIAEIWNSRNELKSRLDAIASSLIKEKTYEDADYNEQIYNKMIKFLSQITGLQIPKAAFVVQLVYGRKACLDINNIDIWTNIAKAASFHELEKNLEPIAYRKRKTPNDLFPNDPLRGAPTKWIWDQRAPFDEKMGAYDDILKGMYKLADINPKKPKEGPGMVWDTWSDFLAGLSNARGTNIYKSSGAAAAQKIYNKLPSIDIPKFQGKNKRFDVPVGPNRGGQAVSHQHLFAGLPFGTDVPKALDQSRTLAKHIVKPSELGDLEKQQLYLPGMDSDTTKPISRPQSVMNLATEPDLYNQWLSQRIRKKGKSGFAHKIQFKDWLVAQKSVVEADLSSKP